MTDRRAGVLVPLFSLTSTRSWGIGEIPDLIPFAAWLRQAGFDLLQILPLNEMPPGGTSPYSAASGMAIDPIFIRMAAIDEFAALGGEAALEAEERQALERLRHSPRIRYEEVRSLKLAVLRRAFDRFRSVEWRRGSPRAARLAAYIAANAWWLDDHALFRALQDRRRDPGGWVDWPQALRERDAAALAAARKELAEEMLFHQYVQWLAESQWQDARRAAAPVRIFGDLPFIPALDSADVWAEQRSVRLDVTAGAPPDAFSPDGQQWGLPAYRWEAVAAADWSWLRRRARRMAGLYDGYRVDHVVGFYRTYTFPRPSGPPGFTPAAQHEQLALGDAVMRVFRDSGVQVIAEDLGTVPRFVRESLAHLGIPGYRVLRWERAWNEAGRPFLDPASYPPLSVAASGTHDTEPLSVWWDRMPQADQEAIERLPTVRDLLAARGSGRSLPGAFDATVRDLLLETLFRSGSNLLILPIQDLFGWTDRINVPASTSSENWTWRLPVRVDRLDAEPEFQERQQQVRVWSRRYDRASR